MTEEAQAPRFMVEAVEAARSIFNGITARCIQINFAWQPVLVMGMICWLAIALCRRLMAATLSKYRTEDEQDGRG